MIIKSSGAGEVLACHGKRMRDFGPPVIGWNCYTKEWLCHICCYGLFELISIIRLS
jgi:hypothetical protein